MQSSFASKLKRHICNTNVGAQKINNSRPQTYGIVITLFQIHNKDGKSCFFQEIFLQAENHMNIAFGMLFFALGNVEVVFNNRKLRWRLYTTTKVFFTTMQIELIEKKEIAIANLDLEDEIFVFNITSFAISDEIHLFCKTQITPLKIDETPSTVSWENFNFVDGFSLKLIVELPDHKKINNYALDLVNNKQRFNGSIYGLGQWIWRILKLTSKPT